jgi:hypothetical protein
MGAGQPARLRETVTATLSQYGLPASLGAHHQLAKESILLREPAEFTWKNTVSRFETAAEVGHVRKAPSGRNFTDVTMSLEWILQSPVAARQPPGLDETDNRRTFLSKQRIRVPHTHPGSGGDSLSVKPGIS